jgi:hypothetical protein
MADAHTTTHGSPDGASTSGDASTSGGPAARGDRPTRSGGGHGGGFFAGFAPWILYWILVGNVPFSTAIAVAFALSLLINVLNLVQRRPLMVLEVGNTVAFVALGVLGLVGGDAFVVRWIQPLGNAALLAIMVVSVLIKKPFTLQYARASTPPEVWDSPGFLYVNNLITYVWIAAMAVMTALALIPPIVQGSATMNDGGSVLSIVCYWVARSLRWASPCCSRVKFPDWFSAEFDDAPAAPAAAPATPIPVEGARPTAGAGDVTLTIAPADVLPDEVPAVHVAGLAAGQVVAIGATTVDLTGAVWHSDARFAADHDGVVDTAKAAPEGTAGPADPAALVWSMTSTAAVPDIFIPSPFPTGVAITATPDGGPALSATLVRRAAAPGVRSIEVAEAGVVGRLFLPAGADGPDGSTSGAGSRPGVVLFGGSEGGIDAQSSNAALPLHGYRTVGNFKAGPARCAVRSRSDAGHGDLVAVGASAVGGPRWASWASRGARPCWRLARRLPVGAVVTVSPSRVSWQAIGDDGSLPGVPSFTLAGEPVPFLAVRDDQLMIEAARRALHDRGRADPHHPHVLHLTRAYAKALEDPAGVDAAAIPVEAIAVPILLLSGAEDEVWPSGPMAEAVLARRGPGRAGDHHEHYAGAGHLLRMGLTPTTGSTTGGIALGGHPAGQAAAEADLTPRVLTFLATYLPRP